jgi:hypothetical protein
VLAVIDAAPDVSAFIGGVEVGLSVAFIVLVGLGGLSIVRRIMGA